MVTEQLNSRVSYSVSVLLKCISPCTSVLTHLLSHAPLPCHYFPYRNKSLAFLLQNTLFYIIDKKLFILKFCWFLSSHYFIHHIFLLDSFWFCWSPQFLFQKLAIHGKISILVFPFLLLNASLNGYRILGVESSFHYNCEGNVLMCFSSQLRKFNF